MFSLFSVFFLDWTNGLLNICIQQEKIEKLAWIFGWYCDSGNVRPFYFMFRHPIAGPLPTIKGQKERHHQILCLLWFSENTLTKWSVALLTPNDHQVVTNVCLPTSNYILTETVKTDEEGSQKSNFYQTILWWISVWRFVFSDEEPVSKQNQIGWQQERKYKRKLQGSDK